MADDSLKVDPISGVAPEDIAMELRDSIRNLFVTVVGGGGGGPKPAPVLAQIQNAGVAYMERAAKYETRVGSTKTDLLTLVDAITTLIVEVDEVAKLRKPSLIRSRTEAIRQKLAVIKTAAENMQYNAVKTAQSWRAVRDAILAVAGSQQQPTSQLAAHEETLRRCYALVQSLPLVKNAPIGGEETVIRAIVAVMKAHYGVDVLSSFEGVPTPDMPVVIMHGLGAPKPAPKPEQIETYGFKLPFRVYGQNKGGGFKTGPFDQDVIARLAAEINAGYNYAIAGTVIPSKVAVHKTIKAWNDGNCSLEKAVELFKLFRIAYTGTYVLEDAEGSIVIPHTEQGESVVTPAVLTASVPV